MAKKKRKTVQNKKTAGRRAPRVFLTLFLILFILLPAVNGIGYEIIFSCIDIAAPEETAVSRSAPCLGTELSFRTEDGTEAYGTLYTDPLSSALPQAIVLLVPGIAASGLHYMPLIEAFVAEDYAVLTLEDAPLREIEAHFTDDEESRNCSLDSADAGLPGVLIRLRAAIAWVKSEQNALSKRPLILFGHSRGAYAAGSVLSFEDADAAVLVSGFDSSGDMLLNKAAGAAGPAAYLFYPYARLYEIVKFGPYALSSVTKGALDSDTPVLIAQCLDDESIPAEKGILHFEECLRDDADVRFLPMDHGGHTPVYEGALLDGILSFIRENVPEP